MRSCTLKFKTPSHPGRGLARGFDGAFIYDPLPQPFSQREKGENSKINVQKSSKNAGHYRADQHDQRRLRRQRRAHPQSDRTGEGRARDLIVFPEVTIQGYTSLDWFLDKDVVRSCLDPLSTIIEATEGLTAIVGTVRPNDQVTGRRLYNSAAVIRNQTLLGFADKTLLPEYDVFDDPRYFEPSPERRLVRSGRLQTRDRGLRRLLERQNFLAAAPLPKRSGSGVDRNGGQPFGLDQCFALQ